MDAQLIASNIAKCRARLDRAAGENATQIMAVTKTMPAEVCNIVWDQGIACIGENRVQELTQKLPALNPRFQIELIGQLQTNKVKYIVDCVTRVQSLDRMSLAQALNGRMKAANRVMPCLVEVNIARETQRAGVFEEDLVGFVRQVAGLSGVRVEGLMAVMPIAENPEDVRPYFRQMRTWFERLRDEAIEGTFMTTLSMGMSHDYVVAAEEGATQVRLGSAIFGARG